MRQQLIILVFISSALGGLCSAAPQAFRSEVTAATCPISPDEAMGLAFRPALGEVFYQAAEPAAMDPRNREGGKRSLNPTWTSADRSG